MDAKDLIVNIIQTVNRTLSQYIRDRMAEQQAVGFVSSSKIAHRKMIINMNSDRLLEMNQ